MFIIEDHPTGGPERRGKEGIKLLSQSTNPKKDSLIRNKVRINGKLHTEIVEG